MSGYLLPATALVLALTSGAWAQTDEGSETGRTGPATRMAQATGPSASGPGAWDADAAMLGEEDVGSLADRVIGMPVLTEDGERVGDVRELIVDRSNRVRGVVVSVGRLFEPGPSEVGVAWEKAEIRSTPDNGEALVVRGLTSDEIDPAPFFRTGDDAGSAAHELQAQPALGGASVQ